MTGRSALISSPGAAGPAPGRETDWQDRALCAEIDPRIFFPEKSQSAEAARSICRGCEVRLECLEYALGNGEEFGVWGGTSEAERRRILRTRRQAAPGTLAETETAPAVAA